LFICIFASVSAAQLQSSVETLCPGDRVTFTCTISSTSHQWVVSSLGIDRTLAPVNQGGVITDPPFQFMVTVAIPGTSIISTATVNASENLNNTFVSCRDGNVIRPDQNNTIIIIGERAEICIRFAFQHFACMCTFNKAYFSIKLAKVP